MSRNELINKLWGEASTAKKLGAPISIPIAVAQAILESGWGRSQLSNEYNNYFGIKGEYKGKSKQFTTREENSKGESYYIKTDFRYYVTISDCFTDYGSIIRRLSWYQDAEDAAHIPKDFLKGLEVQRDALGKVMEPGWATDHAYFSKVWSIVQDYDLLDRNEDNPRSGVEFGLVQVYEGEERRDFVPLKITIGNMSNGKAKLMIRVEPKQ